MSSPHQSRKEFGAVLAEVAGTTAEVLVLILKIFYAIIVRIGGFIIPKQQKSVRGDIVLVTGGGHGIGKEIAFLYASEGATVVVWDINEKNGAQTVKEIAQLGYPKAYFFVCNVSDRENVLRVAKDVQSTVGDVTILFNNAGVMPTHSLLEHTKDEIERVMNVNVMAHFWTLEAFLPAMKNRNHGHIVSLSSTAGLLGLGNLVPYCCSKFAVRGLMEALFQELRATNSGVKVTSIYPFIVNTGLCKKPIIKFENLMPIIEPKEAARQIMKAQRKEITEITIPGYLFFGMNFARLFPLKAQLEVLDFFGIGVGSDLE